MSTEKIAVGVQAVSTDGAEQGAIETVDRPPALSGEKRAIEKRIIRKIDCRLVPVTALIYLLCYVDRSNIGNAKILNASTGDDILQTNHMTTYQYTIALMLFLVAYSVFEAPSNLMIKIATPRRWLGFLVISFGALCAGIGGTKNAAAVTALRFFLGAAEAGVFPGMVYYYSFWYRPEELAKRIASFLCSATLSGAFGGCIAYGVGHMNGAGGLEAWRWLFIIEGIPTVVLGVFVFLFLPSYPEDVDWLTNKEKAIVQRRLGVYGNPGAETINWADAKAILLDGRMYVHYMAYGCAGCGVASLSLFSPTIVQGLGYTDLQAQLYTIPPYAVAYVFTLGCAYLSDKFRQRGVVAAGSYLLGCVSYIALAALPAGHDNARYGLLCLATAGVFGGLPALIAWVGANSHTTTAGALSTAMNVAVAGPGQVIGVWIYRAKDAPIYRLGHGVNAGFLFLATVLCSGLTVHYRRKNAKLVGTSSPRWAV